MKRITVVTGLLLAIVSSGSAKDSPEVSAGVCPAGASGMSSGACPSGAGAAQESPSPASGNVIKGKVAQTMDAGRYTYVAVNDGSGEKWAAVPTCEVKVGEVVEVRSGMMMKSFHSKSLNRTFPEIVFAETLVNITRNPSANAVVEETPVCGKADVMAARKLAKVIPPPEDGKTVFELISQRASFAGKTVTVRGKVMKYTPNIMGKNWIHIQDGTGPDGEADLAVTTEAKAKVGDVLTLKGVVAIDKDFGYGYRYDILVEGASVVK